MPKSAGHDIAPAGKSPNRHAARATPAIAALVLEVLCVGKSKDTGFWGNASVLVTESSVNVSGAEQIPVADADFLGAARETVDVVVGLDVVGAGVVVGLDVVGAGVLVADTLWGVGPEP